jgi:hypothetical protein
MQEFHVLGIVVEPQSRLHFAGAHADPGGNLVVAIGPVKLWLEIVQAADLARVALPADAELVRDRHGEI